MNKTAILFSVLILVLYIAAPDQVLAQTGSKFVTCDGFFENPGGDCNFCHLVQMANQIITWLIGILFVLFAIVMAVAGFQLVTSGGNQSALDAAKTLHGLGAVAVLV